MKREMRFLSGLGLARRVPAAALVFLLAAAVPLLTLPAAAQEPSVHDPYDPAEDLPEPFVLPETTGGERPADPPKEAPAASVAPVVLVQPVAPSPNMTINLINRLVARGILTKEDADDLIRQAQEDAVIAKAQADQATRAAVVTASQLSSKASGAPVPAPDGGLGLSAVRSAPEGGIADAGSALNGSGAEQTVSVTYVPDVVREQMQTEIKQQVMEQAKAEGWASPNEMPDWVKRFRFAGDVRVRYEGIFFPEGNVAGSPNFVNYNAINTGSPYDVSASNPTPPPYLDVDQDRNRARLRARFGVEAALENGFSAGLRLATGNDNSPVSENQSLGATTLGQGGNFSKYAVWLDRGYIKYELGELGKDYFAATFGRFDNPWFSTNLIWANDIGFDGLALTGSYEVADGVVPFLTGGAFPIFNTDLNFSSTRPDKFESEDKWLYAVQGGTSWQATKDVSVKLGTAFYYFDNVEGRLSSPYVPLTASDAGDTDGTRPSFAQKGNTYRPLRNIVPVAANGFGTIDQFQYFGLATKFQDVAVTGQVTYGGFDPFMIWMGGEFAQNLAWNKSSINAVAVNNRGATNASGLGSYVGGPVAWQANLNLGQPVLAKFLDWNVSGGYKYLESDSVIDGFNDTDFGGGGTNLEGYVLRGNLAINKYVWGTLSWYSAQNITGPQLKVDVFQIDLNAKF